MNIQYPLDGALGWGESIRSNFRQIENEMANSTNSVATIMDSTGYGVISGLTTYAQASPNMTVGVLNGTLHMQDGARIVSTGNSSIAISTADATNPRIDIIYMKSDKTIGYLEGTALPSPTAPTVPSGAFLLSEINVGANATSITNENITDKRKMKNTTDGLFNKIGDLTGNGMTETDLASAIKNDRSQLSERAKKNAIINGDFRVNQRVVSGTVTLSAGQYGHDRWKAGANGCTYTFATSGGVTTITITTGSLIQVVEGINLQTGTYILSWVGTSQGKIGAGSYSASGVTSSVTGGTNLNIEFGIGTISNVQFEKGSKSTSFESRLYGEVELMCKRYYNTFSNLSYQLLALQDGGGNYRSTATIKFPKMRVTPSVILTSLVGTTNKVTVGDSGIFSGDPSNIDSSLNAVATTSSDAIFITALHSSTFHYFKFNIKLDAEL